MAIEGEKKPYQPTKEEIEQAEKVMSAKQKRLSKIREFDYEEASADWRRLTEIEKMTEDNLPISKEDLIFLYYAETEVFGYERDPRIKERIKEIIKKRKTSEDVSIILDYAPDQIASGVDEINPHTKVYCGELAPGIFSKLPDTIERIYKKFPGSEFQLGEFETGSFTVGQLNDQMKELKMQEKEGEKHNVTTIAQNMIDSPAFSDSIRKERIRFIRMDERDIWDIWNMSINHVQRNELYKKAKELGLELCPAEMGPQAYLNYEAIFKKSQPRNEELHIAMSPIKDEFGTDYTFDVTRRYNSYYRNEEYWLSDERQFGGVSSDNPNEVFLFCLPKK